MCLYILRMSSWGVPCTLMTTKLASVKILFLIPVSFCSYLIGSTTGSVLWHCWVFNVIATTHRCYVWLLKLAFLRNIWAFHPTLKWDFYSANIRSYLWFSYDTVTGKAYTHDTKKGLSSFSLYVCNNIPNAPYNILLHPQQLIRYHLKLCLGDDRLRFAEKVAWIFLHHCIWCGPRICTFIFSVCVCLCVHVRYYKWILPCLFSTTLPFCVQVNTTVNRGIEDKKLLRFMHSMVASGEWTALCSLSLSGVCVCVCACMRSIH